MSKQIIIKLGMILAIVGWWICIFVILDHIENAGEIITITLIMSGVLLSFGFLSFCRRNLFRWCIITGKITKENPDQFYEFSVPFGMLQVITGNRFKPRTNKAGQPIDDAGLVRACLFDSTVEVIVKAMLIVSVIVKFVFRIVDFF